MAANVEKQQGHRAGAYKQKNKVHKHGKHRTKGEIERENKGKPNKELLNSCCRSEVPAWVWLEHTCREDNGIMMPDR